MPLHKMKVNAEAETGTGTGAGIEIERLVSLRRLEVNDVGVVLPSLNLTMLVLLDQVDHDNIPSRHRHHPLLIPLLLHCHPLAETANVAAVLANATVSGKLRTNISSDLESELDSHSDSDSDSISHFRPCP
jgi:hypothetical protein